MTLALLFALMMGGDPCDVGAVRISVYDPPIRAGRESQLHASLFQRDGSPVSPRCPVRISWGIGRASASCKLIPAGPMDPGIFCATTGSVEVFARAGGTEGVGMFEVVR